MPVTDNGSTDSAGFNAVSTTGSHTYTLGGAAQTDAMLVATIGFTTTSTTPQTVSSITDANGNVWQKYFSIEAHAGWNTGQTVNGAQKSYTVEIWFTKGAIVGTSIGVTVNFSGTIDTCVVTMSAKILGYDHTDPFDRNASLPKVLTASGSTAETITGISTDTTHIYPMWALGIWGTTLSTSNVVFNGVTRNQQEILQHNGSEFTKVQFAGGASGGPGVTGPYAGVTFSSPTSAFNYFLIGYAITADSQAVSLPLDGSQVLEWNSNAIQTKRFHEADYDSIWSRGDRVANGLITVGDYGFPGMFAPMSESFDNRHGTGLGNGVTPQGDTSAPFIPGLGAAVWWDTSPWSLELQGIKWLGTESIADDGVAWRIVGGFDAGSVDTTSFAQEFDDFMIEQTVTDPDLGGSLLSRTLDFTPRAPVSWPHYEIMKSYTASYTSNRLSNEFLLKYTHSILDGGDRRSTNGRPDKQVIFTMSSNWTFSTGGGLADPASALFDGKYNRTASGESAKGGEDCSLIKSVTGSGQHPQTTVGEWLQFQFPRKVRMHHIVFNIANGDLESNDSGGNPTNYGKWHWEVSDVGTESSFVPVGGTWQFTEDSEFMVAPFASPAAGFGLPDDGGHKYWRMKLDAGPAFGNDKLLAQIIFHLDDPGNQEVGFEVAFTDDIDTVQPVLQPPVPGNPFEILLTDDFVDALGLTLTVVPNLLLTIAFDDGDNQFNAITDLSPSIVVQSFTYATGR